MISFDLEINNKTTEETIPRIAMGDEISIINSSEGKYHRIVYDFGDGSDVISYIRDQDQIVTHKYEKEGFYVINVKIYSTQGCFKELEKTILAGIGYSFTAPNAFTPNLPKDGHNDEFRPIFSGFTNGLFNIYTRSGLKLYSESFDYRDDLSNGIYDNINKDKKLLGWDGYNRDESEKVFYYQFIGETLDGEEVIKSNYFTAITKWKTYLNFL